MGLISQADNGSASEKATPGVENSKELCTLPPAAAADPGECGPDYSPPAGDGVTSGKTEATAPDVAVAAPIAEGGFLARRLFISVFVICEFWVLSYCFS